MREDIATRDTLREDIGAFIDELARCGIRHLCLCPGSRSTPLALLAVQHPAIRTWTLLDERSAAYFALGMAKALREPVAVLSTSGTAAANFYPAVIEAYYGRVPLVVLTADRPHELRDVGAAQTVDQVHLYGHHVKWFHDLPLPDGESARHFRTAADRAMAMAREVPAGPVHLNFPFREPLVPAPASFVGEAPQTRFQTAPRRLPDGMVGALARAIGGRKGIIVAGPRDDPSLATAAHRLSAASGFPLLADPLSQARYGNAIATYDAFLRDQAIGDSLAPEVVLRTGALPTSKPLNQWLQRQGCRHIVIDDSGWNDPLHVATDLIHADPAITFDDLAVFGAPLDGWAEHWHDADDAARRALEGYIDRAEEPFEGRIYKELDDLLPQNSLLWVGSSMPVRDLDSFFPGRADVRVLANRGANGIDGVTSSALGASTVGPLVLVLGDLSFYHDMNGLLASKLHGLNATIILSNNDGGGIFSFLPQAGNPDFELLFGTPHGLDFRPVISLYDVSFHRADGWFDFRTAVADGIGSPGLSIVEVVTDRERNVALHRGAWEAVAAALEGVPA